VFANIGVYLLQQMAPDGLFRHFALWPLGQHFVPGLGPRGLRALAARDLGVLHDPSSMAHIGFNMFALYSFGMMVERGGRARNASRGCTSRRC
jgi:membrane associated rhomboid family serine protease